VTEVKRAFIIVLDSVGIGALPDAALYGDEGSDTLGNIARALGGLSLPNLGKLGVGNLDQVLGTPPITPSAACARLAMKSPGKDTTAGHWELCGVILDKPFRTYPEGFPPRVIQEFESRIGRQVLGNKPASGTEIIKELGPEHVRTGKPIVYTSADSVFQVACHEEVVPLSTLYAWCQIARDILTDEDQVARVIARPFVGTEGSFRRTENRRDFSLPPPRPTLLDYARESKVRVTGIGKIQDIFAGRGLDQSIHTKDNAEGIREIIRLLRGPGEGLVIANLVDFDMVYGHRNDVTGYARALLEFDAALPDMLAALRPDDLFVVTADHGCDPTTPSTDHSREYVPALLAGEMVAPALLPDRKTMADLGATVADLLGISYGGEGESFASQILR